MTGMIMSEDDRESEGQNTIGIEDVLGPDHVHETETAMARTEITRGEAGRPGMIGRIEDGEMSYAERPIAVSIHVCSTSTPR